VNDLLLFPILSIVVVIAAAITIRLSFHREHHLEQVRTSEPVLSASYSWQRPLLLIFVLLAAVVWVAWQVWSIDNHYSGGLKPFYIFFGAVALAQLFLAAIARPYRPQKHIISDNKPLKTAIIMAVYNESEYSLRQGLESFFRQTQLPDQIHIVDDGSTHHYKKTQQWLTRAGKKHGVATSWNKLSANAGKRLAHSAAYDAIIHDDTMIVITIDSDSLLDPRAIEEGLKPFQDPRVQSVAGVVIAKNAQDNLLSRITDLIFVSSQQLIDRASMSQFGSVLVNSGGLAFYRSAIVRSALDHGYTEELFFDRPVVFSDDSYLTLFALINGRAVQQPSSIVFADMPVSLDHHIRQQVRWGRGSFIRSWWRLRHLPMYSFGYLRQIVGWAVFAGITSILIELFVVAPIVTNQLPSPEMLAVPVAFSYLQAIRYFAIRRSDMSRTSQAIIFAMAPLAMVWSTIGLRTIRLYAMATCHHTVWGTRQKTEILHPLDDHA
jgi:hyaluronan synthase